MKTHALKKRLVVHIMTPRVAKPNAFIKKTKHIENSDSRSKNRGEMYVASYQDVE